MSEAELERIGREYRHVQGELHRAPADSRTKRKLDARLRRLGRLFEKRLAEAPLSERGRERLRDAFRRGVAPSPETADVRPLLFRGRSESGSELLLLPRADGTIEARVDGATVEILDRADELEETGDGFVFALEGVDFRETFSSPQRLLVELRAAMEAGGLPGEESLRALMEDGLVDRDLGLTVRGRRALALDRVPARRHEQAPVPAISIRGPVPRRARALLAQALAHAVQAAPRAVLRVDGSLTRHEDAALARPVVAKAAVDLGRLVVRARAAAATESEAVTLLESRLHRKLRTVAERDEEARREGRLPEEGEWRRRDLAPPRRPWYPRPADERRVIRRTTYAAAPTTPDDAAAEMALLGHDFHLFVDAQSGEDALVYVRPDGLVALRRRHEGGGYVDPFVLDAEPTPVLTPSDAVERLSTTDEPFLFFLDAASGRGAILYHRYDGHYGLVVPEPSGHEPVEGER